MRKLIGVLLCVLVLGSAFAQNGSKKLKITDFTERGTFGARSVYGLRSMNDGLHYSTMEDGSRIEKYSYKTGKKVATLLDLSKIENSPIKHFSGYAFSADEKKILLTTSRQRIYRHSFTAQFYVWDSFTQELLPLSEKKGQQLATFSPDGERIAFVWKNNLYIKSIRFKTEHQVTFDGEWNKIINGAPDWVYEEEFGFNKAFAWSPDSKTLAYYKFNETEVPLFGMTMFEGTYPKMSSNALYPTNHTFKYPKAGEKNSIVELYLYDLKYKKSIPVDLGEEKDQYIPRIKWTKDANKLCVMRLNRLQNKLDFLIVNGKTGYAKEMMTEKNDRYIAESNLDNLFFLNDGQRFLFTSEKSGYTHIYMYNLNGFELKQITKGDYDVTKFYGFDSKRKLFYYQAAAVSPMQREIYYVSLDGKKQGKLSTMTGTNSAVFSKGFQYYINYFSNTNTPTLVTLHDRKGKQLRTLQDNAKLKSKLKEYTIPNKEFIKIPVANNLELNAWIIKPTNFDANKKYPVMMTQYSGPNSQQVLDRWGISWNNYLAQEGYIVVCVDPRGTGARGEEFRKCTYMQLGRYESDDQIQAAQWLAKQPYIAADKIAIWGWSFGGFMVNLCMEKGDGVFAAGISIAPVTNWRYYDSIYTERYMRTPQENPEGYDNNSPLTHANKLKGNLLLVHGSADDNVHVQNTMEFSERLVQAGIQFDMAIYTNRNHSIYGGKTRTHLYNRFTKFLNQQLKN